LNAAASKFYIIYKSYTTKHTHTPTHNTYYKYIYITEEKEKKYY